VIRWPIFGALLTAFAGQIFTSNPATALSCSGSQEIRYLDDIAVGGFPGAGNIIEALVEDVTVNRLPAYKWKLVEDEIKMVKKLKGKAQNKELETSLARQFHSLNSKLRELKREVTISLKVKTLEVFRGEALTEFNLINNLGNISGAPNIGRCDGEKPLHEDMFGLSYRERIQATRLFKSRFKPNPLSGYPWHSCSHYKSLKGQRVILLGKDPHVLCNDHVIEIEELSKPEWLREFFRCSSPAVELAGVKEIGNNEVVTVPSDSPAMQWVRDTCPNPMSRR
jgi:hypothetical protein